MFEVLVFFVVVAVLVSSAIAIVVSSRFAVVALPQIPESHVYVVVRGFAPPFGRLSVVVNGNRINKIERERVCLDGNIYIYTCDTHSIRNISGLYLYVVLSSASLLLVSESPPPSCVSISWKCGCEDELFEIQCLVYM